MREVDPLLTTTQFGVTAAVLSDTHEQDVRLQWSVLGDELGHITELRNSFRTLSAASPRARYFNCLNVTINGSGISHFFPSQIAGFEGDITKPEVLETYIDWEIPSARKRGVLVLLRSMARPRSRAASVISSKSFRFQSTSRCIWTLD